MIELKAFALAHTQTNFFQFYFYFFQNTRKSKFHKFYVNFIDISHNDCNIYEANKLTYIYIYIYLLLMHEIIYDSMSYKDF